MKTFIQAYHNTLEYLAARPMLARLVCLVVILVFWGGAWAAFAAPKAGTPAYVFDNAAVVKATGERLCIVDPEIVVCAPMGNYDPAAYLSLVPNERPA